MAIQVGLEAEAPTDMGNVYGSVVFSILSAAQCTPCDATNGHSDGGIHRSVYAWTRPCAGVHFANHILPIEAPFYEEPYTFHVKVQVLVTTSIQYSAPLRHCFLQRHPI